MAEKQTLRKTMMQKLTEVSCERRCHLSEDIVQRLMVLPEWQQAETVGMTMSTPGEIDTMPIIERAWAEKKRVVVPKADSKEKTMDFRSIHSFEQLETAFAGIREPILEQTTSVIPGEIDLLIVPGLAFDENGYRLGFGGGFYDRFLVDFPHFTIGLAFEMQIISTIPLESFDRPVDMMITPERILSRRQ